MSKDRETMLAMLNNMNQDWKNAGGDNFKPDDGEYVGKLVSFKMMPKKDTRTDKDYVLFICDFEFTEGDYEGLTTALFMKSHNGIEMGRMKQLIRVLAQDNPAEDLAVAVQQLEDNCLDIEFIIKFETTTGSKGGKFQNWTPIDLA